ncbi:hypothetical protein AAF712_008114 [Marasmius tenuissimus]|uniref:Uncharacterized protein n=1 Tax=Marasmius tenuissimus TaxID=585030 RepID=A0ABR2ZUS7_9AGAR
MEYKAYNQLAAEGEETISQQTIRQLVLQGVAMRVSSRPVDMVLSVLGLMGIEDVFQDRIGEFRANERFYATLALVEAMLCLEEDEDNHPTDSPSATSSTLVDLPLWQNLELVPGTQSLCIASNELDPARLPSLRDIAQLLDNDNTEHKLFHHPDVLLKRRPLSEWTFDVEHTEDDPSARATAIAVDLSDDNLLQAYSSDSGKDRVIVRHGTEGFIELRRRLELKGEGLDAIVDLTVFGWSLHLDGHPYIRFYKFDISHLTLY